jgi:hypothetical protein
VKAELTQTGLIRLTELEGQSDAAIVSIEVVALSQMEGNVFDLERSIKSQIVSAINQARENAIAEFFEGDHGGEG